MDPTYLTVYRIDADGGPYYTDDRADVQRALAQLAGAIVTEVTMTRETYRSIRATVDSARVFSQEDTK
jgi:hypothetical protein